MAEAAPWFGSFRLSAGEAWIIYANPQGQELVRVLRDRCVHCGSTDRVEIVHDRGQRSYTDGDTGYEYEEIDVCLCHACRLDHYGVETDDELEAALDGGC